jgi:phosphoglycolate phosphatase-like HAD superfamily hydrolase
MPRRQANSANRVYILDIDGTLIPSARIDNRCYWQAVFACFGKRGPVPDLHTFTHVTDSGILQEWCLTRLGRPPSTEETRFVKQEFLRLTKSAYQQDPESFRPLPGVEDWLQSVRASPRQSAGIATGGWGHTARLKLRLAGLDRFRLPLASADDASDRVSIMRIAARRITGPQAQPGSAYIYFGDGCWDYHASQELGWRFVGIATGTAARRLLEAGASEIRPDFRSGPVGEPA